ncbi:MAG: hypothetical protein KDB36_15240 [Acidimicrobiales bacterium]|nr:hypothetical protein [Acidimicrobiales bacterium]
MTGELVAERFGFDGGRAVRVHVPAEAPEAVLFCGDAQIVVPWGGDVDAADAPATLLVGVDRVDDEELRLHEYSPSFDPERFAAHETFIVDEVRPWVRERFGFDLPPERTAAFGVSAGGELALALAMRHPDVFGAVLCASPGGGYRPPDVLPDPLPRAYLVAGAQEPWFGENAARWAAALGDGGADVVLAERDGEHGGAFWRAELPAMVRWLVAGS